MNIFISLFSGVNDPLNPYAIPSFYETFIKKLEELGNNLYVYISKTFAKDFNNIPPELFNEIKGFDPDLIILFNNTFYDISKSFDCPIIVYEVDSPLYYSNKETLKENINRYKFIVPQDESINVLKNEFCVLSKNIQKIPFFTEIQPKSVPFKNNICFIGTKFFRECLSKTPYKKFIDSKPSKEEKEQYFNLLKDLKKNPWIEKDILMQNYENILPKVKQNFSLNEINFCLSDFNRRIVLSSIAELGLDLYGDPYWETDTYNEPDLIMSYINKRVYSLSHNEDIYNSCKIGININHRQAISGFSWRVCDIMGSNACLVSEYKSDIKKYFGNIIPTFDSPFEAREVCIRLLKNENLRKDIVAQSHEIINKNFRFNNILPVLETFIENKIRGKDIGKTRFILEKQTTPKNNKIKLKYKLMKKIYSKFEQKLRKKGYIDD